MECAATRRAPISYLGDAMAERTKEKRQAAPAAKPKTAARGESKGATTGSAASGQPASTSGGQTTTKPPASGGRGKSAAKAADAKSDAAGKASSAAKSGASKKAAAKKAPAKPKQTRSAAETERIRAALAARLDELREEYHLHVAEIAELQRDRLTDSAGDDQADTGSKTYEREQEISLANSILERTTQVERALERLDEGSYGWCERCGDPIPVERLAAFPSATLCVACKQLEERR